MNIDMSLECIEPRPRVIRHITLRRLRHKDEALVGAIVGAAVLSESKCDTSEEESETRSRDLGTVELGSLLVKELEESNNWGRLVLQLYFGWFALQFTVNGVAMGWLFSRVGPVPWYGTLIFLVFVGWNLMGTIGTVMVYKGLAAGDLRMTQLIESMAKTNQTNRHFWPRARSGMPLAPIRVVFSFCVVTMFISLGFWIVMFVVGR